MGRLVIVSNRMPLPSERGARAGGLAVALQDALQPGTLWMGWSGKIAEETSAKVSLEEANGITYASIDLAETDHQRFYVGFANSVLWPLLHFRAGLIDYKQEDYEGYLRVNRSFAQALAPLLRPDDLIWVHDYHLIPLAAELRELGCRNRIGFFLHIPFVPPSLFETIPGAADLVRAMCRYDVVGFQTARFRDDFISCAAHFLGAVIEGETIVTTGARARAIVDPIGIDARQMSRLAVRAQRSFENHRMRQSLVGRTLIIGVDRLDYSKGIPGRFNAFATLLTDHPELRGQVSYLQVAAISRGEVREYDLLRQEIDQIAGNINGRFAEFDWVPLRYMTRAVSRNLLAGLYRAARVGLVTPLRDGMNLVAKEYIAAQEPTNPGVLILSQFAGAAEDMSDALLVNPVDPGEIATALARALAMPLEERRERFDRLSATVFSTTAQQYCRKFIESLNDLS